MCECKHETCFECNLLILLSTKSTCKIEHLSREFDRRYHVMREAICILTVVQNHVIGMCRRIEMSLLVVYRASRRSWRLRMPTVGP